MCWIFGRSNKPEYIYSDASSIEKKSMIKLPSKGKIPREKGFFGGYISKKWGLVSFGASVFTTSFNESVPNNRSIKATNLVK